MLKPGQFVDALFPFSEQPEKPGPTRHIALVFQVLRHPSQPQRQIALAYYTTTAPDPGGRRRLGTIKVNEVDSLRMGMSKAFTIDVTRFAAMPFTDEQGRPDTKFLPDIDKPHLGIKGTASPHLMNAAMRIFAECREKHVAFEALGPIAQLRTSARAR